MSFLQNGRFFCPIFEYSLTPTIKALVVAILKPLLELIHRIIPDGHRKNHIFFGPSWLEVRGQDRQSLDIIVAPLEAWYNIGVG